MSEVLTWMVFSGAVCYARQTWGGKLSNDISERARYHYTWEMIWALQRELGCKPIGLIRSC